MHIRFIPSPTDTNLHKILFPLRATPTENPNSSKKKKPTKQFHTIQTPQAYLKSLFKASDLSEEKLNGLRASTRNCSFPPRRSPGRSSASGARSHPSGLSEPGS